MKLDEPLDAIQAAVSPDGSNATCVSPSVSTDEAPSEEWREEWLYFAPDGVSFTRATWSLESPGAPENLGPRNLGQGW